MHIVISKRNKRICHIPNWVLSLLNLSGCLHGNSCAWAVYEGFLCIQWIRFREACSHHYSTSGFLLQISLLHLPSSLTSPFDLSPLLLLLLLLLPPMGSLIYALSTLITKNDLWKSLETSRNNTQISLTYIDISMLCRSNYKIIFFVIMWNTKTCILLPQTR